MPDGDLVHYIDQVDTVQPVLVRARTGARIPLHAVSSGQVLLAFRTPAAQLSVSSQWPMERFTDRMLTMPIGSRAAARSPPAGLHLGDGMESRPGSRPSPRRSPMRPARSVGAVHVHGPSYRFPAEGSKAELAQQVLAGAARIAAGLRET